jgi:hypothetical protein
VKYYIFRTYADDIGTLYAGIIDAIQSVMKRMLTCKWAELDIWLDVIRATMGFHVVAD